MLNFKLWGSLTFLLISFTLTSCSSSSTEDAVNKILDSIDDQNNIVDDDSSSDDLKPVMGLTQMDFIDITAESQSHVYAFAEYDEVDKVRYFYYDNGTSSKNFTIYKTDGTAANTVDAGLSTSDDLVKIRDDLYLFSFDAVDNSDVLFKTYLHGHAVYYTSDSEWLKIYDGVNASENVQWLGGYSGSLSETKFYTVNDKVFFQYENRGVIGLRYLELSDPNNVTTHSVTNVQLGGSVNLSFPETSSVVNLETKFIKYENELYFLSSEDGTNVNLYKTTGQSASLVKRLDARNLNYSLVVHENKLHIFYSPNSKNASDVEYWVSDESDGTNFTKVKDLDLSVGGAHRILRVNIYDDKLIMVSRNYDSYGGTVGSIDHLVFEKNSSSFTNLLQTDPGNIYNYYYQDYWGNYYGLESGFLYIYSSPVGTGAEKLYISDLSSINDYDSWSITKNSSAEIYYIPMKASDDRYVTSCYDPSLGEEICFFR